MLRTAAALTLAIALYATPAIAEENDDNGFHVPGGAPAWALGAAAVASPLIAYARFRHESDRRIQSEIDQQQNRWSEQLLAQVRQEQGRYEALQAKYVDTQSKYGVLVEEFKAYRASRDESMTRMRGEIKALQETITKFQALLASERNSFKRLEASHNKLIQKYERLELRYKALVNQLSEQEPDTLIQP